MLTGYEIQNVIRRTYGISNTERDDVIEREGSARDSMSVLQRFFTVVFYAMKGGF